MFTTFCVCFEFLTIKYKNMLHEIYRKEMNQEPCCADYSNPWGKYNDDYVHWLERNAEKQLKILNKHHVVGRSEQLIAFLKWLDSDKTDTLECETHEEIVDTYIKSI